MTRFPIDRHDTDILIFCISQLMAGLNAGREVSRTLTLTAHDLLLATGRETSGDAYSRLKEAFERLAGTRITTNIAPGTSTRPSSRVSGRKVRLSSITTPFRVTTIRSPGSSSSR